MDTDMDTVMGVALAVVLVVGAAWMILRAVWLAGVIAGIDRAREAIGE